MNMLSQLFHRLGCLSSIQQTYREEGSHFYWRAVNPDNKHELIKQWLRSLQRKGPKDRGMESLWWCRQLRSMKTEVKRWGGSELGQRAEALTYHIRNTGIMGLTKRAYSRFVLISEQLLWNQKAVDSLQSRPTARAAGTAVVPEEQQWELEGGPQGWGWGGVDTDVARGREMNGIHSN